VRRWNHGRPLRVSGIRTSLSAIQNAQKNINTNQKKKQKLGLAWKLIVKAGFPHDNWAFSRFLFFFFSRPAPGFYIFRAHNIGGCSKNFSTCCAGRKREAAHRRRTGGAHLPGQGFEPTDWRFGQTPPPLKEHRSATAKIAESRPTMLVSGVREPCTIWRPEVSHFFAIILQKIDKPKNRGPYLLVISWLVARYQPKLFAFPTKIARAHGSNRPRR